MKVPKHTLPASVLATVLVVCTLMLLTVLLVIELRDMSITRYHLYRGEVQARANVEAGFLLYGLDSAWQCRLSGDSLLVLYDGREDSGVRIRAERWGMYEVAGVEAGNGRSRSVRLFGKEDESGRKAALYIPENDRSVSLAGNTVVDGYVCLPRNGVAYTQVRSEFFCGKPLGLEFIRASGREFPAADEETRRHIDGLLSGTGIEVWVECAAVLRRSFLEPVAGVRTGNYLSGVRMEGHLVLYAPEDLFIEQDNRLENVIVVGKNVRVADGFSGSLQIFASDTIQLGERVVLKAGSGLYAGRDGERGCVRLGGCNEINGFVVVGAPLAERQRGAAYFQPETSRVRGLVYVDGVAEVHGIIAGSLYARACFYFAPEGYYQGTLYNVALLGSAEVVYPMLMQGAYRRKEVKWLD